jgi:[acyl-carrier-protein] S-malonyltransferase
MVAVIFPGQGAQFSGMGRPLYDASAEARLLFARADELVGFALSETMFTGSADDLRQTRVTQPAVFLHSVVLALTTPDFSPDMVAGHSLGEFSALVAAGALSFDDGLRLVLQRAEAMQRACEQAPSTMAAVIGLSDEAVEAACAHVVAGSGEPVVAANYNSPGQVVISGSPDGVRLVGEHVLATSGKKTISLAVGGAFHSPFMEPAREELARAIAATSFASPRCPVYQNVTARPVTDVLEIRANLMAQLTGPVRWTQSVEQMMADGATEFRECGPGVVLQKLVRKISPDVSARSI